MFLKTQREPEISGPHCADLIFRPLYHLFELRNRSVTILPKYLFFSKKRSICLLYAPRFIRRLAHLKLQCTAIRKIGIVNKITREVFLPAIAAVGGSPGTFVGGFVSVGLPRFVGIESADALGPGVGQRRNTWLSIILPASPGDNFEGSQPHWSLASSRAAIKRPRIVGCRMTLSGNCALKHWGFPALLNSKVNYANSSPRCGQTCSIIQAKPMTKTQPIRLSQRKAVSSST